MCDLYQTRRTDVSEYRPFLSFPPCSLFWPPRGDRTFRGKLGGCPRSAAARQRPRAGGRVSRRNLYVPESRAQGPEIRARPVLRGRVTSRETATLIRGRHGPFFPDLPHKDLPPGRRANRYALRPGGGARALARDAHRADRNVPVLVNVHIWIAKNDFPTRHNLTC
jgi:hypothetical protein